MRHVHAVNFDIGSSRCQHRGMTITRQPYHHGDLRNALIVSALRLIEEGGPESFSLREAAREVGVSANAAYRHFEDKSALMTAAAADGFERLAKQMIVAMERASRQRSRERLSIARFKAVGRAYIEFAAEHPELFRVMFGECGSRCLSTPAQDEAESRRETPWTLLGQSLDALVADGVLTTERREGAELKAWTVVHGFASLALDGHAAVSDGRARQVAIESVLDFAVIGICGESPGNVAKRR